jgi:hypothetical protein
MLFGHSPSGGTGQSACHCLPTRIVERKRGGGGGTDGNGESDHGEVGNEEVCRRLGESTRDED